MSLFKQLTYREDSDVVAKFLANTVLKYAPEFNMVEAPAELQELVYWAYMPQGEQRNRYYEEFVERNWAKPDGEAEVLAPKEEMALPREREEELLQRIREQVEEKEAFLDSHLSLAGLSQSCGINRTYVSTVLSGYKGGFFAYINSCRLAYAEKYRAEHPQADVDEVALNSGFNSRQSYYNAKKRLAK